MELKKNKVEKALLGKGFIKENKDHRVFFLEEKKTINTHLSHGTKEIDNFLISAMSKQMKLTKEEFISFVNCTLTKENYLNILRSKSIIE